MGYQPTIRRYLFVLLLPAILNAQKLPSEVNLRARGIRLECLPGAKDIFRLIGPTEERILTKTIEDVPLAKSLVADLTIDMSTLDTAQYASLYRFKSEVPLGGTEDFNALDADHNGKKEIYGGYYEYDTPGGQMLPRVYEFNGGTGFTYRYQYPDSLLGAMAWDDLGSDGTIDLIYRASGWLQVLTQTDSLSLPRMEKLHYDIGGNPSYMKFADINGDGRRELIYRLSGAHPGPITTGSNGYFIETYDNTANTFRVLFCAHPQAWVAANYSLGDFDQDGHQAMALGDIEGQFYMIEHQSGDTYAVSHVGKLPVKNAFLTCFTNDMDGNGKPELWMGGDMYVNGVGLTRLMAYEATGNDTYAISYTIDLRGIFSFYAGNLQAVDMDHDGREELLLCIDQHVLIFKSMGVHQYTLWYARANELSAAGENSVVYAAWATDFLHSDYPQILVGMDFVRSYGGLRYFSRIYEYTGPTTAVQQAPANAVREYSLAQNYPNPFNGRTTVRYNLAGRSPVRITVYDILGKGVRDLINSAQDSGEHQVVWDGRNEAGSELPSGVYFIRLQAGSFTRTIKAFMIK